MSDLKQRLIEIVSTQLGVESDEVVPEARILDDLGADSLDVVELMMSLEEAFDLTVPDEDVESLTTIGEMQSYLQRNGAH